jgi:hypothetical protein
MPTRSKYPGPLGKPFEWSKNLRAWLRPAGMSDDFLTTAPLPARFDRQALKLTIGSAVFDVQAVFREDDPHIPYWVAEYMETESLKREFGKGAN